MNILLIPFKYLRNLVIGFLGLLLAVLGDRVVRPSDSYGMNLAVALDQFCNAVLGGDPRETISSRADKARAAGRRWGCILCRFLGKVATWLAGKPTDHCTQSIMPSAGTNAIIPDGE